MLFSRKNYYKNRNPRLIVLNIIDDDELRSRTLIHVLVKFFSHTRFALIAFFNFLWTKPSNSSVSSTNIVTALQVGTRVAFQQFQAYGGKSRCKGEMIKVHKNAPPNREADDRSWKLCGNSSLNSLAKYRFTEKADRDGSKNTFPRVLEVMSVLSSAFTARRKDIEER